jgi:hypothetical protein
MDGSVTCLSALAFPQLGRPIDVGEAETAAQAWQKVCNLQRTDEVIRFIKVISGGIFLERGDYFVAVAASCGRWRVEGRESRRADTRVDARCNFEPQGMLDRPGWVSRVKGDPLKNIRGRKNGFFTLL